MYVKDGKKHEYWNHFVEKFFVMKDPLVVEITGPRLRKVKPIIWEDEFFWNDIIWRHSGVIKTPEEMEQEDRAVYEHCQGNFWGMIVQEMVERGVIKT